jgi:hypothetical protein
MDVLVRDSLEGNGDSDLDFVDTPSTSKANTNVNKRKRAAPKKNVDAVKPKKQYKPRKKSGKCRDKLKLILDAYMQHKHSYIM